MKALFWIYLHDLPLMARNVYMGCLIRNSFSQVVEVDREEDEVTWGEYLRMRININITKPHLRGKGVNIRIDKPYWIRFSYERLPNFCYICGRLGHGMKECIHGGSFGIETTLQNLPNG